MSDSAVPLGAPLVARLWQYQRERFPLAAHGPLVVVLAVTSVAHASALRAPGPPPGLFAYLAAAVEALLAFLLLRIADEFKDAEDDRRQRPYRPVPRGLVTLPELAALAVAALVTQAALVLAFDPRLLVPLGIFWAYAAAATAEFGVGSWLRRRPLAYALTHLPMVAWIHWVAASWAGLRAGASNPALIWFLAAGSALGFVFEIGRKSRAPEDEEAGVVTYTAAWGASRAALAWIVGVLAACLLSLLALRAVGAPTPIAWVVLLVGAGCGAIAMRFAARPDRAAARAVERASLLLAFAIYSLLFLASSGLLR